MAEIERIIAEYGPALTRIAASYERAPALREELVQEILLAIHEALPRLKDAERLKPFLFRIAHNRAVSHVARQVREPDSEEASETIASSAPTPEQAFAARERATRLFRAVRKLSLPYRQVITLILEDLSHEEIAEALGISVSNVGVRASRAKEQLRALLNDE